MDLRLERRRVLVTGGTKSIGRAIVDTFLAKGAIVSFCARDAKIVKERETEWRSVVFLAGALASFATAVNFVLDGAITARGQY